MDNPRIGLGPRNIKASAKAATYIDSVVIIYQEEGDGKLACPLSNLRLTPAFAMMFRFQGSSD